MPAPDGAGSLIAGIDALDEAAAEQLYAKVDRAEVDAVRDSWAFRARPEQLVPEGDWRLWLIMAGRGFGKTRAGAEWVDALARAQPGIRIALIGATIDDVRQVMIEGESGILNIGEGERPIWSPSLKRLLWPGGSMATCYSAAEPEGLRGPQHHAGWADEVARWDAGARGAARSRGQAAFDNLLMGLRLGTKPQLLATTTPRAVPLMRAMLGMPGIVVRGGPSHDNAANLPPDFLARMDAHYGGTPTGRQEIGGEMIDDVPGALWRRGVFEEQRQAALEPADAARFARIVIGVDPPASSHGDACGIIVAGALAVADGDLMMLVIEDASVTQASPERWAGAVAAASRRWGADRIIAEANMGGEMVRRVIEAEDAMLPVVLAHASRGKAARAEPVALAYARGRIAHAGRFARLEDEMCGLLPGGDYAGPGRSPDRADAAVWALAALMDGLRGDEPRVRRM
jgi:phage terminase large subunit-like protein